MTDYDDVAEAAVVKPHYATEEAYNMGFDRFETLAAEETEDFDLSHFKETATWANTVAPRLRAMAGFADTGPGTYTLGRTVAAVVPGCEEDEPADAEITHTDHVFRELVEAFDRGAYDAAEGREKSLEDV